MALQLQLLALAAQVEGHEMAQVIRGNLPLELQLEWRGTAAISPGLLADLHHQIPLLGAGVDQLATHGEVVVALGELVGAAGLGEGARLPHPHQLQVQLAGIAVAGVGHPQVGLGQIKVAAHQRQHPAEHHRLDAAAVLHLNAAAGELLRVVGQVGPAHHTDGPVLHRFGDRGNGVLTHRGCNPQGPA